MPHIFRFVPRNSRSREEKAMHCYSTVKTEIGEFWTAWNSDGITTISLTGKDPEAFENAYALRFNERPQRSSIPDAYSHAIQEAAAGRAFRTVAVNLPGLSKFQLKVLQILQKIPRGEVRTYGWLAEKAGRPGAARAVGNTMARNPIPILIPCHRVVTSSGGVGRYGLGSALKRALLMREGVAVDKL
jgi:methylated-DNA-[protein]-cysteine S-methyltransferase